MTRQEAAMEMVKLREMMLFDPILGNEIDYSSLNEENKSLYDAAGVAIEVLRAQEEAEKNEPKTMIDNTKWPSCERCVQDGRLKCEDGMPHEFRVHEDAIYYFDKHYGWEGETISFCPFCGRPLTDEAWTELKKRLEALNDGKTN